LGQAARFAAASDLVAVESHPASLPPIVRQPRGGAAGGEPVAPGGDEVREGA
jgi:hypothetical protein